MTMKSLYSFVASVLVLSTLTAWGAAVPRDSTRIVRDKLTVGTSSPVNTNSALEVTSTTKGFLPPRMTQAERNAMSLGTSDKGLQIFNTDTNKLNVFDGSAWGEAGSGSGTSSGATKNFVVNPSAAVDVTNWTATNITNLLRDTDVAYKIAGVASFIINGATHTASALTAAMTLDNDTVGNCEASGYYKGDGTKWKFAITTGADVVVHSVQLTSSTAAYQKVSLFYPCTSGYKIGFVSTAASPADLHFGGMFWGLATGIGSINQITNWQSFTPTINGVTFTNSGSKYRRVGQFAEVWIYGSAAADATGPVTISPTIDGKTVDTGSLSVRYNAGSCTIQANTNWMANVIWDSPTFSIKLNGAGSLGTSEPSSEGGFDSGDGLTCRFSVPILEWANSQTALTLDTTPGFWSGNHGTGCSWSVSGASIVDPSDDGSACALTETQNKNFGSVTTYGAAKPGIIFTPKDASKCYEISATFSGYAKATSNPETSYGKFALVSGSGSVLDEAGWYATQATNGQIRPVHSKGYYCPGATTAQTIKIIMGADSGTSTSGIAQATSGFPASSIYWTIKEITGGPTAPIILDAPYSAAYVQRGSASNVTSTIGVIKFGTGLKDPYQMYSTSTGAISIRADGLYLLTSCIESEGAMSTVGPAQLWLMDSVPNTLRSMGNSTTISGAGIIVCGSTFIQGTVGQTYYIGARWPTATPLYNVTSSTWMEIHRVGN